MTQGPNASPARTADFDSPWKEAIDAFFQPFMALFFPVVHDLIDWHRPHEFLDAELQRITGDSEIGRRYADRLVKVYSREGAEIWLLLHLEVQARAIPQHREDRLARVVAELLHERVVIDARRHALDRGRAHQAAPHGVTPLPEFALGHVLVPRFRPVASLGPAGRAGKPRAFVAGYPSEGISRIAWSKQAAPWMTPEIAGSPLPVAEPPGMLRPIQRRPTRRRLWERHDV